MRVGIIMGSDSDLPIMTEAANVLVELEIEFEMAIVSAHRTPDRMVAYANTAEEKGIGVIIAGAGGAAHLPGMVASFTSIPVIGVPIHTKNLDGLDSYLSIVQMPAGVPVACVAVNGSISAGILAAKMISIGNAQMQDRVKNYMEKRFTPESIKKWLKHQR